MQVSPKPRFKGLPEQKRVIGPLVCFKTKASLAKSSGDLVLKLQRMLEASNFTPTKRLKINPTAHLLCAFPLPVTSKCAGTFICGAIRSRCWHRNGHARWSKDTVVQTSPPFHESAASGSQASLVFRAKSIR
jgi:hypothetical protein